MQKSDPKVQQVYSDAVSNGCTPFWHDGIFGWAWHCGCPDLIHACDQQCSMIDSASSKRAENTVGTIRTR